MRILITGAEGFLGSNLTKKLMDHHAIFAIDYLKNREHSNLPKATQYINQDLSTMDISKIPYTDLIIHLASIGIESVSQTPEYASVNMSSTLKILELARKNRSDLILSSSGSVYGSGLNFKEEAPYNPLSLYAIEKINEENLAKFYQREHDLNIKILRYTNCYGDTTFLENKYYPSKKDVIRIFMENILQNNPLPFIENQSRDFTFIDDVVEVTTKIIKREEQETFNIGSGIETPIYYLPVMISEILDKPVKIKYISPRTIDNLKQRSLNIDKISKFWKPKYSLKQGLKTYAERLGELIK